MGVAKSDSHVQKAIESNLGIIHEQRRTPSVSHPPDSQPEAPPLQRSPSSSGSRLPKGILKPPNASTTQKFMAKLFGRYHLPLERKNSLPIDKMFIGTPSSDELAYSELKRVRFSLSDFRQELPGELGKGKSAVRNSELHALSHPGSSAKIESTPEEILHFYLVACKTREEKPIPHLRRQFENAISAKSVKTPISGEISLANHAIQRRAMEPLADVIALHTNLTKLSLENCSLTNESLKILLHGLLILDSVHTLSLARNLQITGTLGLKYIAVYVKESRTLRYLDLSGTSCLSDKKMSQLLAQALTEGPEGHGAKLETLKLNGCLMKASVLERLAPALRRSNVRNLYLRNNKITGHATVSLGVLLHDIEDEYIQRNPSATSSTEGDRKGIEILDVTGNEIKGGIQYIGQALRRNRVLKHIVLAENHLDSRDLKVFADLLRNNRTLKELDLSRNHICTPSIEGLTALKTALAATAISTLSLAETQLGTQGAIVISEALLETVCLRRLDLSGNRDIAVAGVAALAAIMKINTSVTFLDINVPQTDSDMSRLTNDILLACTRNVRENPCTPPIDETKGWEGVDSAYDANEEHHGQSHSLRILHPLDLM